MFVLPRTDPDPLHYDMSLGVAGSPVSSLSQGVDGRSVLRVCDRMYCLPVRNVSTEAMVLSRCALRG